MITNISAISSNRVVISSNWISVIIRLPRAVAMSHICIQPHLCKSINGQLIDFLFPDTKCTLNYFYPEGLDKFKCLVLIPIPNTSDIVTHRHFSLRLDVFLQNGLQQIATYSRLYSSYNNVTTLFDLPIATEATQLIDQNGKHYCTQVRFTPTLSLHYRCPAAEFFEDLNLRLRGITLPSQRSSGTCVITAFLYCLFKNNLSTYKQLILDLQFCGEAQLGGLHFTIKQWCLDPHSEDTRINDYHLSPVDWITITAMHIPNTQETSSIKHLSQGLESDRELLKLFTACYVSNYESIIFDFTCKYPIGRRLSDTLNMSIPFKDVLCSLLCDYKYTNILIDFNTEFPTASRDGRHCAVLNRPISIYYQNKPNGPLKLLTLNELQSIHPDNINFNNIIITCNIFTWGKIKPLTIRSFIENTLGSRDATYEIKFSSINQLFFASRIP